MKMTRTVLAGLLLSLAACGGGQPEDAGTNVQAPVRKERPDVPVSLKERDPEAYRGNVGSVMSQVPPEKQEDFKKLMACKVQQGAAAGKPVIVDTAFLTQLLAKLNTDSDALLGCE